MSNTGSLMTIAKIFSSIHAPDRIAFAERLNHALDLNDYMRELSKRAAKYAKTMKVTNQQAFAWLNGIYLPKSKEIKTIAAKLMVNESWLKLGDGEPLAGKHSITGKISIPELSVSQVIRDEFCHFNAARTAKKRFAAKIESHISNSFSVFLPKELLPVSF